mmetsp:Transcript_157023/g.500795  ORF Transcript_157023/g.500795 Transcript_157023/m.500795 type:complete len:254 (+) Transcript_157023:1172-1933(+)
MVQVVFMVYMVLLPELSLKVQSLFHVVVTLFQNIRVRSQVVTLSAFKNLGQTYLLLSATCALSPMKLFPLRQAKSAGLVQATFFRQGRPVELGPNRKPLLASFATKPLMPGMAEEPPPGDSMPSGVVSAQAMDTATPARRSVSDIIALKRISPLILSATGSTKALAGFLPRRFLNARMPVLLPIVGMVPLPRALLKESKAILIGALIVMTIVSRMVSLVPSGLRENTRSIMFALLVLSWVTRHLSKMSPNISP